MKLPEPRGTLTRHLLEHLREGPHDLSMTLPPEGDPLAGDDFHLALYLCYELHYRGFDGVDDRWEWEPSLIDFRRSLEDLFEEALRETVEVDVVGGDTAACLRSIIDTDSSPSLSSYMQNQATVDQYKEFITQRSAYQLKEADPHSWALPRLSGRAKAAMAEIQADEYGSGFADRIHARLFANTMESFGLDSTYGAYLSEISGVTLATVNLMSLFGLHRRWRGAAVGHLAAFEMSSSGPNRKYANGLRRLGCYEATEFFDEHVEADAVHETIAAHDMAGALAQEDPSLAADILFGAQALVDLDASFAGHLLDSWRAGRSSLYEQEAVLPQG